MAIGDCLTLINGRAFKPAEWTTSGKPIIRIQNLNNPEASYNYYEGELPEKFAVRNGDLLFAWSGTPGTSFGAHVWHGEDAWLNQHIFKVLFSAAQFDKQFLRYAINQNLDEYIRAAHGGAGLAHITKGRFEASVLLVPSLAEQRQLVDEIERQFTRLDAGVAGLERVRANLKRYRAAVLKAACEGTLVPTEADLARAEGRDYETGDQLLERILTTRRENWTGKGKHKTPTPPDAAGLPQLPEGWIWATTEQLTSADRTITYGVVKLGPPVDGGVPVLRSSDVRHLRLDLEGVKTISPGIANTYARTFLKGGEIVITVRGTLGGVTVVPPECSGFNISREVAMLAPVLCDFIAAKATAIFIGAHTAQQWLLRRAKGIAYTGINIETLKELPLPLPPLAEQHRIVAEVERRLSIIDELDTLVETNLARASRLRQSILAKAFSGELVPASGNGAASPPPAPRKKKGPPSGGPEGRPTAGKGPVQSSSSR
ncbi:MAG: restriction endonuclease subunit S [Pirellulales bacterium]